MSTNSNLVSAPNIDLTNPDFWETAEAFIPFCNTLSPWFAAKGYVLYPPKDPFFSEPSDDAAYTLTDEPAEYPYASIVGGETRSRSFSSQMGILAAVNSKHRDVIIKLVQNPSSELAIFTKLTTEPMLSHPSNFTVPILEILPYNEKYSFIVMPRWQSLTFFFLYGFDCLETALLFTSNMLEALSFLHENGIVHRDLNFRNILVNYQGHTRIRPHEQGIETAKPPRFVLCDFNISMLFSEETPRCDRLLPASFSDSGTPQFQPPDAANGETTYDPFAFDVACLGGVLCQAIGRITTMVPPLAPFLDKMITPDVSSRYTASQALNAFTELVKELDGSILLSESVPLPISPATQTWQSYDRWAGLPEDFVRKYVGTGPIRPRRKADWVNADDTFGSAWVDWDAPLSVASTLCV
ncbi:hypothetical protein QCA50_020712 [Cerrena zonata]|uniref:Protein kinase domain-containing protein n=1 Tax=Cerrena zonata TaxID=2478898 RepID=A0AAW0FDZ5_9APHY